MQGFLAASGEHYCVIGGLALQRWGRPRFTRDVDITLLCPFGSEAAAADRLLARFRPRIDDARAFAMRRRVLLLWSRGGIGIDVAFGAIAFEERCVERASEWRFDADTVLYTCSAEDLIVLKAFAGRAQDWIDIESVLVRQRRSLDWNLVLGELKPLLDLRETPENLTRLLAMREDVEKAG